MEILQRGLLLTLLAFCAEALERVELAFPLDGVKAVDLADLSMRWLQLWRGKDNKALICSADGAPAIQSPECQNLLQQLDLFRGCLEARVQHDACLSLSSIRCMLQLDFDIRSEMVQLCYSLASLHLCLRAAVAPLGCLLCIADAAIGAVPAHCLMQLSTQLGN